MAMAVSVGKIKACFSVTVRFRWLPFGSVRPSQHFPAGLIRWWWAQVVRVLQVLVLLVQVGQNKASWLRVGDL